MRIPCPFCGEREHSEFLYLGAAGITRPPAEAPNAARLAYEAAYVRDNPAGPLREHWYHGSGCRRWLTVERDTRTHAVLSVAFAEDV